MFHLNLQQMLLKFNMLLSRATFCMSFILKTKHDTVSMLHSVEDDQSRSWFLWSRSPLGLGGLMKSDPSFIKIQGWGLVIKKKEKEERIKNRLSLTRSHLRSTQGDPKLRTNGG